MTEERHAMYLVFQEYVKRTLGIPSHRAQELFDEYFPLLNTFWDCLTPKDILEICCESTH